MCRPECDAHGPMQFRFDEVTFVCNGFDGEGCFDLEKGAETRITVEEHLEQAHPGALCIVSSSGAHARDVTIEVANYLLGGRRGSATRLAHKYPQGHWVFERDPASPTGRLRDN